MVSDYMHSGNILNNIPIELCYDILSYLATYEDMKQLSQASWKFELAINQYVGIFCICHRAPNSSEKSFRGDKVRKLEQATSVIDEYYQRISPNVFTIFIELLSVKNISTKSNLAIFKQVCERYPYVVIEYHKYQDGVYGNEFNSQFYDIGMNFLQMRLDNISYSLGLYETIGKNRNSFHITFFEPMDLVFSNFQHFNYSDYLNAKRCSHQTLSIPKPNLIAKDQTQNNNNNNKRKRNEKPYRKVHFCDVVKLGFLSSFLDLYPKPSFRYDSKGKELGFDTRTSYHNINFANSDINSKGRDHLSRYNKWSHFNLNGNTKNLVSMDFTFINTIQMEKRKSVRSSLNDTIRNLKPIKILKDMGRNNNKGPDVNESSFLDKESLEFDEYLDGILQTVQRNAFEGNTKREIDFIKLRVKKEGLTCWKKMFNASAPSTRYNPGEGVDNLQWLSRMHSIFITEQSKTMELHDHLWNVISGRKRSYISLSRDPLSNAKLYERKDINDLYNCIFLPLFPQKSELMKSDLLDNVKFIRFNLAYNHHQLRKNASYDLEMHKRTLNELLKLN
ncbi:hypothetical protein WICMUC_003516 [Wickerhamomyces mucosus]|uniref:F-box domain-containing protein n=1 Tax=Wickerhamomyces mucosus TaxID=1378264 RepID=A0A9P8TCQ1_9ASCO|nr:hypothetical protein WICMUC_003516 [Wickerhamomyces mucosus]